MTDSERNKNTEIKEERENKKKYVLIVYHVIKSRIQISINSLIILFSSYCHACNLSKNFCTWSGMRSMQRLLQDGERKLSHFIPIKQVITQAFAVNISYFQLG